MSAFTELIGHVWRRVDAFHCWCSWSCCWVCCEVEVTCLTPADLQEVILLCMNCDSRFSSIVSVHFASVVSRNLPQRESSPTKVLLLGCDSDGLKALDEICLWSKNGFISKSWNRSLVTSCPACPSLREQNQPERQESAGGNCCDLVCLNKTCVIKSKSCLFAGWSENIIKHSSVFPEFFERSGRTSERRGWWWQKERGRKSQPRFSEQKKRPHEVRGRCCMLQETFPNYQSWSQRLQSLLCPGGGDW